MSTRGVAGRDVPFAMPYHAPPGGMPGVHRRVAVRVLASLSARVPVCARAAGFAFLLAFLLAALTVVATPRAAHAQGFVNELTLSTGALVVPEPTIANFASWPPSATGPVSDSVPLTWQLTTPRDSRWWRYVVVSVRCDAVTGGKPCGDVEWRDPSGTWRALSPAGDVLDARWLLPGLTFDDYGSAVWLRWRLGWDDPAPATHVATVGITVEVYRL